MLNKRILFVIRKPQRHHHGSHSSGGLLTSAKFVSDMLSHYAQSSNLVQVIDGNGVDKELSYYKPTHAVLEAVWLTPEKLKELQRLHPNVYFTIRVHSEVPFLASEGMALKWLVECAELGAEVSANSDRMVNDLYDLLSTKQQDPSVAWLPNYYSYTELPFKKFKFHNKIIDIGCFGATRLLKNQVTQALAALAFARSRGLDLRFHVNSDREEGPWAENVVKNLGAVLGKKLVVHSWLERPEFLQLVSSMDVGMQVSFSETFNITAADMVGSGLPVVVSPEVRWASGFSYASPNSVAEVTEKLHTVTGMFGNFIAGKNVAGLNTYIKQAKRQWLYWLESTGM